MSKKRRASLDSKWKLSKARDDYKQHKQNKKAGGAGYAEEEPDKVPGKVRRGLKCKKTRGEHEWELQEHHKHRFMDEDYNFYKCAACGKEHWQQKYDFVCEECGEKGSWFWLLWRERDRRKCKKCGSYRFKKINNPILGK